MTNKKILEFCLKNKYVEEQNVLDKKSECCNAQIRFTENSGVYICPNIYCSKCKKLLH